MTDEIKPEDFLSQEQIEEYAREPNYAVPRVALLQALCGAVYQAVGAADGPEEMLDNLAAAMCGERLPHAPDAGVPWETEVTSDDTPPSPHCTDEATL